MVQKARVGIAGASGYGGGELIHLLSGHPGVTIARVSAETHAGEKVSAVFPNLPDLGYLEKTSDIPSWDDLDILFMALPAGSSSRIISSLPIPRPVVIDLGPDYRFRDSGDFHRVYKMDHGSPNTLSESTYGLVEWNRKAIRNSRVIGSPGCFPTGALLGILPFVNAAVVGDGPMIVDGKSGVSGAGRGLSLDTHFPEIAEGMKAYKPLSHRHIPEMENALNTLSTSNGPIVFVPHLIPVNRGLISTIYLLAKPGVDSTKIDETLAAYAEENPFVRIVSSPPSSAQVRGTNRIDIHATIGNGMIVVMTAIDNLVKGAAGQAIQSMNLVLGYSETLGLPMWGSYP